MTLSALGSLFHSGTQASPLINKREEAAKPLINIAKSYDPMALEQRQLADKANEYVVTLTYEDLECLLPCLMMESSEVQIAILHLLTEINSKTLICAFVEANPRDYHFKLSNWLSHFLDAKCSRADKSKCVELMLGSLNHSQLNTVVEYILNNKDIPFVGSLLIHLNDSKIINTFVKVLTTGHWTFINKRLKELLIQLAQDASLPHNPCSPILQILLQFTKETLKDETSWQYMLFLHKNKLLNSNYIDVDTAVTLLRYMPQEARQCIGQHYAERSKNIAGWISAMIAKEQNNKIKIALVRDLINDFSTENFVSLFKTSSAEQKNILPFLLCACSEHNFGIFCGSITSNADSDLIDQDLFGGSLFNTGRLRFYFNDRSNILQGCVTDNAAAFDAIAKELAEQNRMKQLVENTTFSVEEKTTSYRSGQAVVTIQTIPMTLSELCRQVNHLLEFLSEDDKNEAMSTIYAPQLQSLPPFLVGLGMTLPFTRTHILKLLPYWSEDQLKEIAKTISNGEFTDIMQQKKSWLNDQIRIILSQVNEGTLADYCSTEVDKMDNSLRDVETSIRHLEKYADSLEKLASGSRTGKRFTSAIYNRAVQAAINPYAKLAPYSTHMNFLFQQHISKKSSSSSSPQAFTNYLERVGRVKEKLKSLATAPYNTKISDLEKFVVDKDKANIHPTDLFPLEFVHEMTTSMWNLAGFKQEDNPYELLCNVGIQTTDDLKMLKYDQAKERLVRQIEHLILDFMKDEKSPFSLKPLNEWNALFYESKSFDEDSKLFVKGRYFADSSTEKLKSLADSILAKIFTYPILSEKAKLVLQEHETILKTEINEQTLRDCCLECVRLALQFYRSKAIIFSIMRYYRQDGLKEVWRDLHEAGITKLSELLESGHVTTYKEIYELAKLSLSAQQAITA